MENVEECLQGMQGNNIEIHSAIFNLILTWNHSQTWFLILVNQAIRDHQITRIPSNRPMSSSYPWRPWDSPGKNTGVGCHFLLQCMKVKSESEVAQSCPTPSDPMDCSAPGFSVHGIFQARVLEWDAIAFSHKWLSCLPIPWSVEVKVSHNSC